jgi:hypothetical protein
VKAEAFAVQIKLAGLADALEFEKLLFAGVVGRQFEAFAIPRDAGGMFGDGNLEGRILIPRVRQCDRLPRRVVARRRFRARRVTCEQLPTGIKVIRHTGRCLLRRANEITRSEKANDNWQWAEVAKEESSHRIVP